MSTVHRIEVRPRDETLDARGAAVCREAAGLGLPQPPRRVDAAGVYLIEGDLTEGQVQRIADELLADPVTERAVIGAAPARADALIEVHPLPGVMDPDAEAVEMAIRSLLGTEVQVRTGRRYDLHGAAGEAARLLAERALANPVIHAVHEQPYHPGEFPRAAPHVHTIVEVPLRDLDDQALEKLSREAHLFLSLEEMQAIQQEYRTLGREPRDIELETLAQTWSEHCVHKTLKATFTYREEAPAAEEDDRGESGAQSPRILIRGLTREAITHRPGHVINADGSITIHNLLRSTVAAATHELIERGIDWCLSVFVDNAGIIAFDDEHAVCFKVETHNHPSAIEPYGGAATGIGGCIRDIIGTGLAAKPIAATDVFCVAHPDHWDIARPQGPPTPVRGRSGTTAGAAAPAPLPQGVLHPRRVLTQVVAGVRDYGNRMGIPTLNGAVWFDDDYLGNPLVFCGCVGVMPRDRISGDPQPGDRIIAVGGRTGRDGIHGATFSSAELTGTHADEFAHAVQIGNPVTEKKMLDAILAARDGGGDDGSDRGTCLYNAITDCGAGGFSSAVGEMGSELGAEVHLENAPLKYQGLTPTEIWISEAQERMVLAVPPQNMDRLREIFAAHDVEVADLGRFGTEGRDLILNFRGEEIGRLPMQFLHEGIPQRTLEAVWKPPGCRAPAAPLPSRSGRGSGGGSDDGRESMSPSPQPAPSSEGASAAAATALAGAPPLAKALLALLGHPNIASKHWIIRQYDHEVQGRSVIKPLLGPRGDGPSDAAVILPVEGSTRGLAIACGLATALRDDPYLMALAGLDECVRNLVCVGADPQRIAILDNFCWPGVDDPHMLGALVRAAEGCYDGAIAYRTPFISGKDSLNNQYTTDDGRTIRIPPTLLISGFGIVDDVRACITMDAKRAGSALVLVGRTQPTLTASHYQMIFSLRRQADFQPACPRVDLDHGPQTARAVAAAIARGIVRSAHDLSDGGALVAAAEMAFAGDLGLELDREALPDHTACFGESPSRYLIEIAQGDLPALQEALGDVPHVQVGRFTDEPRLVMADELDITIDEARSAWRGTLDW